MYQKKPDVDPGLSAYFAAMAKNGAKDMSAKAKKDRAMAGAKERWERFRKKRRQSQKLQSAAS